MFYSCNLLNRNLSVLLFSVKTASYLSPWEYRLHKYACVRVCACVYVYAAWISDGIQCVGGLNDPRAPFLSQHLLESRLCRTKVSTAGRLGSVLTSTYMYLSQRTGQNSSCPRKVSFGIYISQVEKKVLCFFLAQHRSSLLICILLICPFPLIFFSCPCLISFPALPPFSPPSSLFLSSGHCHGTLDVDVEQIERLARGEEMEEDSGQVARECCVKIEV